MKILQITHSLGNGGAEKFIVELSNVLSKSNDVVLATFKPNEDWMIQSHNINDEVKNSCLNTNKKYSLKNWVKLYRFITKEKPDIVHVHASLVALYLILLPLFFRKTVFIQTIHNTVTTAYKKIFYLFNTIPFIKLKWMHVCISKNILKDYKRLYPKLNFYHIDNGIIRPKLSNRLEKAKEEVLKEDTKLLIAIGNFSDFKRFDLLAEVFSEVSTDFSKLRLIILGEDKSTGKENYYKVVKAKNNAISLLGLKSNVADYMSLADAFIISSSKEGMPLVVLEAMAMAKPIITTPAGGIVDMVENNINGFISKDLSKESLKASLLEYINCSKEKLETISKNNLDKYQAQYSMEICLKNYSKLYNC